MKLTREEALKKIKELEEFIKNDSNKDVAHNGMVFEFEYSNFEINFDHGFGKELRYIPLNHCELTYLDKKDYRYFDTKENAQKFDNKLMALKKIWKWKMENDGDFIPDWDNQHQLKYLVYYGYLDNKLINIMNYTINTQAFLPYYGNNDIAKKARKELEEEYKILFDVK